MICMLRLRMTAFRVRALLLRQLRTGIFVHVGAISVGSTLGCGGDDGCSPTLHCGSCNNPIKVHIIDESTGRPVGWETSAEGFELVGEKGDVLSMALASLTQRMAPPTCSMSSTFSTEGKSLPLTP